MTMSTKPLLQSGKIDVHNFPSQVASAERRLRTDHSVSERNKQFILDFTRDCELGKTVRICQKKKIGKARITKYLVLLRQIAAWMQVDFDKVTQRQMEDLIICLEGNRHTRSDGKPYTDSVKRDYKITLRKFYKWLLGDNETYPAIVRWIDTRDVVTEISCLVREQIERMSEMAATPLERALIWVLFDSGARVEEFLNMRFRHLDETLTDDHQKVYRVRIEFSKTKPRTILLPIASKYLRSYLEYHPGTSSESQIFPLRYSHVRLILKRVGQKALGKRVNPHLMRHSSATYYAPLLNRASFCYRYGWSYSSNMADRYIDREALNDQESVRAVTTRSNETVQRENTRLQEDMTALRDRLNQMDSFMNTILKDPAVAQLMARKVQELGEGERLRQMRGQGRPGIPIETFHV